MTNFQICRKFPETEIIDELYELRMDYDPNFIMPSQMIQPATVRALVELRLYHLPTYYLIPSPTKSKLCSQSGPCFHLESDFMQTVRVERETFYPSSPAFAYKTREHCKLCNSTRATRSGVCYHCMAKQLNYSPAEERKLCKEYNLRLPMAPVEWTSPKRNLLARELGCLVCGARDTDIDIWTGNTEFQDGLCPDCALQPPFWNTHPDPYIVPEKPIPYCLKCGTQNPYALWGMCDACYYEWQSSYFSSPLQGAEALLISPTKEWRNFILQNKKQKLKKPFAELDITSLVLKQRIKRRIEQ